MKANAAQALAIGWHAEAFARTKRMKVLDEYLKPVQQMSTQAQRDAEARALMKMFDRAIAKQKREDG